MCMLKADQNLHTRLSSQDIRLFFKERGNYGTELLNHNINVCVYICFELEKVDYKVDCESICHITVINSIVH